MTKEERTEMYRAIYQIEETERFAIAEMVLEPCHGVDGIKEVLHDINVSRAEKAWAYIAEISGLAPGEDMPY